MNKAIAIACSLLFWLACAATARAQAPANTIENFEVTQQGGKTIVRITTKEPLEAFPLESIQMMGTITQDRETFALVKAGPNLYRVRKGNYMGQNFGVVTGIDESQITLKELIQDGGGEWVERNSALQLVETKR